MIVSKGGEKLLNVSNFTSVPIDKKKSGARLKKAMHKSPFTIRDLSLFLGVSETVVNSWISGTSLPSVANLVRIRQILGVKTEDILAEAK